MKKIFLFVSAYVLLLTSCSSDDSERATANQTEPLLTKTIETYDDGSTYTTNFTYDGYKLLKVEDSDGESETFVYDANGKLISGVEKYFNGNTLITSNVEYVYNTQNQLVSIVYDNGIHTDYTYNANGTITELNYSSNGDYDTLIYTFSNNNIILVNQTIGNQTSIVNYQFDNLNGPFRNVFNSYDLFRNYFEFDFNNETNAVYDNDTSSFLSSTSTYVYNSDYYPTTKTETTGDGEVIVTQYFY
jgi:YD repeat-containing protein